MKFTKEEISLCKQVAEKYRKPIEQGDWYFDNHMNKPLLWSGYNKLDLMPNSQQKLNVFPLWTISDCLEFIMERGLYLLGLEQSDDYEFSCGFCETDDIGMRLNLETAVWADGETPLEACLKAVLAVLEEK